VVAPCAELLRVAVCTISLRIMNVATARRHGQSDDRAASMDACLTFAIAEMTAGLAQILQLVFVQPECRFSD
jgi:hypothetical protein